MLMKIEDYNLLSNRVYVAIKDAIIRQELKAGEKVTETKLAKQLGVSRTPVREALRALYSEGYVQLTPNSSFVVNAFTEQDVREVLQVRGALEGEAARLAAKLITPEQEYELRAAFAEIKNIVNVSTEQDAYAFHSADVNFHEAILQTAGNRQICNISKSLRDRMYRMRIAVGKIPDSVKICEMHHYHIMQAILSRDEEVAYRLSREHTTYIADIILPNCIDIM